MLCPTEEAYGTADLPSLKPAPVDGFDPAITKNIGDKLGWVRVNLDAGSGKPDPNAPKQKRGYVHGRMKDVTLTEFGRNDMKKNHEVMLDGESEYRSYPANALLRE